MTTVQVSHIDTLTEYQAIDQDLEELTLNTFNCAQSTALNRMFLSYCVAVHSEFSDLSGRFKKRQSAEYGWETSTANPYCRVGKFLGGLPIENIELLDPNTLIAIAKERYQPIHEALEDERLTVADVRSLAKEINALNKKEKGPAKQIEWCGNPRQLKIIMADGSGSMGFESDYKEMASAFQQHVNSDLPVELYIEQVNHVVKSNKQTIAEALGIKLVPPVLHCLADSGAQCPTPNAQCPISNTQCPTPNAQHPISNTQCPTPNAQSPTPNDECIDLAVPTERYKKGWQVGQAVRVNTNAKNAIALREFARDRLLVIYQIIGNPADENQRVHLIREDGEILNLANFGSWLEDDFSLESRINADLMCEANFSPYKEVIELVKELKALQAQEVPKAKTAISKWQKSIQKKQREIDKFTEAETIWFDKAELEENGRLIFVPGGKDFLCNEPEQSDVIEVKNAAQAQKVLLLDEEVLEGNLDKYLGCAVEVCDLLGEIKYGGTLKRFDPNNYLLQIETATGDRVADLRCTWAVNRVATPC
jgi:hypothetical protein